MKRVAVPFIEPKGLLVTTIGVGLTAALLQSVSIRTFIHLWPKPPVPIALTVYSGADLAAKLLRQVAG